MKETRMDYLTDDLERLPRMSTIEDPDPSSMRSVYPRRMFELTIWKWALLCGLGAVVLCGLFLFWIVGTATLVPQPDAPNYWPEVLKAVFEYGRSELCFALTGLLLGGLLILLGIYKGALR
jgi:hypothetical protein